MTLGVEARTSAEDESLSRVEQINLQWTFVRSGVQQLLELTGSPEAARRYLVGLAEASGTDEITTSENIYDYNRAVQTRLLKNPDDERLQAVSLISSNILLVSELSQGIRHLLPRHVSVRNYYNAEEFRRSFISSIGMIDQTIVALGGDAGAQTSITDLRQGI